MFHTITDNCCIIKNNSTSRVYQLNMSNNSEIYKYALSAVRMQIITSKITNTWLAVTEKVEVSQKLYRKMRQFIKNNVNKSESI